MTWNPPLKLLPVTGAVHTGWNTHLPGRDCFWREAEGEVIAGKEMRSISESSVLFCRSRFLPCQCTGPVLLLFFFRGEVRLQRAEGRRAIRQRLKTVLCRQLKLIPREHWLLEPCITRSLGLDSIITGRFCLCDLLVVLWLSAFDGTASALLISWVLNRMLINVIHEAGPCCTLLFPWVT